MAEEAELISGEARRQLIQELEDALAAWEVGGPSAHPFAEILLRKIEHALVHRVVMEVGAVPQMIRRET